jgi:hypothetical protein
MRPAMSVQRPEVGDGSAVKTELASVLLEYPLIVLASGPWRQWSRSWRSSGEVAGFDKVAPHV